ncbi:hypothetical protein C2S53_014964 [Perilla frutescens var. hirtella]|uniref:DDE Tnp4 domain-containing protein n=1 Tax=Perilla frutescens var. hirtella TaxID=608512 RepID=A0AAD4J7T1_PERFH|nr:hypothetical protein C2S53_014964 [Perilla frutescens var. hirtella]
MRRAGSLGSKTARSAKSQTLEESFDLPYSRAKYSGGLKGNRNVSVSEQLTMFLSILAHHTKNRIVKKSYKRSGGTVSKHFHGVLNAIIRLHSLLLAKLVPIDEDCTNEMWKWFKGCLGALDGTYILVKVSKSDRGWYCNRKGQILVNVLGVCDRYMNFTYILTGWEGSATDARVLRDAITRNNGLRVPIGNYYLCDNGYVNGEGFLTLYRGLRYHLDDWVQGRYTPQNREELFNIKHSKARNVIERTFGLLKMRWAILRSPYFYPIKVHNCIILACCLLHNFIRKVMPVDPLESELAQFVEQNEANAYAYVDVVERVMDGESSCRDFSKDNVTSNRTRIWTLKEKEVLVQALKDLVQQGWKGDNGFRTGYLMVLEKAMLKVFPNSDLRGEPYINSKVHDRATGENAEDFNSADNDQLDVNMAKVNEPAEKYSKDASEDGEDDVVSICKTSANASSKKIKSNKRKLVDTTGEKIVDLMGTFCNQTNERLADISKRIGCEFDMSQKRTAVFDALGALGVLDVSKQISVAQRLCNNNKDLDLFFSLPDFAKVEMVRMLILKQI